MKRFKVIKTSPQPQPDYPAIYKRVLIDQFKNIPEKTDRDWAYQFVYFAVKGLPIAFGKGIFRGLTDREVPGEDMLQPLWGLILYTEELISELTPRELTRIFPITKDYSGHKYECKDYFTTVEALNKIGFDNPIGDQVTELLFDYHNRHIIKFNVFKLRVCSDMRRLKGQPGIMESFLEEQGVSTMRMMTDENGRQYLYDPEEHTTFPVIKKRPRYLKVIK